MMISIYPGADGMHTLKTCGTSAANGASLLLVCLFVSSCVPPLVSVASPVPPGAPPEDVRFANEWPSPNGDLYNTRVAHSSISSANVSQLGIAWTLPLQGTGTNGADVANPVMADGIAYLQDGASNVTAVRYATGEVLWIYRSPGSGQ